MARLTRKDLLIKRLSSKRVTNVHYRKGYVSLKFDGKMLRDKIIAKHDHYIANWSKRKKIVDYDKSLAKKDILPILVHEVVEKYVTEKYHLNVDRESHKIAQRVEKRFVSDVCTRRKKKRCHHRGRCWKLHEARIRRLWKRLNKKIKGKKF